MLSAVGCYIKDHQITPLLICLKEQGELFFTTPILNISDIHQWGNYTNVMKSKHDTATKYGKYCNKCAATKYGKYCNKCAKYF